jgi:hypothetical protein
VKPDKTLGLKLSPETVEGRPPKLIPEEEEEEGRPPKEGRVPKEEEEEEEEKIPEGLGPE